MIRKPNILKLFLLLSVIFSFVALPLLAPNGSGVALAATEGTPGSKPMDFVGAYLTTVNGTTSTTGDSVVNSTTVPLRPTIKVVFDKNIANDSVWATNQQCFSLKDASGTNVPINVSKISDTANFDERQNVFITPVSDLAPGKSYQIVVSANLTGKNLVKLGAEKVIGFTTQGQAGDNGTPTPGGETDTSAPVWPGSSTLTATGVTATGLTLNWTAATDDKAVTGYKVYRDGTLLGTVAGTSYQVTGLTAGTQYTFKVEAGDAAGNWTTNGPSATATATATQPQPTTDTSAPVWPGSSTLTATGVTATGLTLNWTAATDDKAVTGYKVYRDGTLLGTVAGTSYQVTSLTAGTQYTFKVEAGDAAGNWTTNGPSATVTAAAQQPTDNSGTAPIWRKGSRVSVSNITKTGLTLKWTAASDKTGVTGYRIYSGTNLLGTVTGTTFKVTGLTAGTLYEFKIEAGNAAGIWSTNGPSAKAVTRYDFSSSRNNSQLCQLPVNNNSDTDSASYGSNIIGNILGNSAPSFGNNIISNILGSGLSCFGSK